MIKAVIFDFDGVLVESVDIKTSAFAELFRPEGEAVVRQVVSYHVANTGVSRFDKFRHIYSDILRRDLDRRTFDGLCAEFSRLVLEAVVAAPFVKGAREFLEAYSSRYKFFISSATPDDEIGVIVRAKKMDGYFAGVYGSPAKKAAIVRDILSERGLLPGEAVYVGDALSDLEAASINGVKFVARVNDNEGLFRGVDCPKINDLTGLKDVIERL